MRLRMLLTRFVRSQDWAIGPSVDREANAFDSKPVPGVAIDCERERGLAGSDRDIGDLYLGPRAGGGHVDGPRGAVDGRDTEFS